MPLITKRTAQQEGRERGRNAASWMFDGNTTEETYRRFLQGYDEGDPAVMDAYAPPSWLSGEWAGESISELLGDCENARDEERLDGVMEAYESAAEEAYWRELVRTARYHTSK